MPVTTDMVRVHAPRAKYMSPGQYGPPAFQPFNTNTTPLQLNTMTGLRARLLIRVGNQVIASFTIFTISSKQRWCKRKRLGQTLDAWTFGQLNLGPLRDFLSTPNRGNQSACVVAVIAHIVGHT